MEMDVHASAGIRQMNYWKLFYRSVESRLQENRGTSRVIRNRAAIRAYLAQPDSSALVTFPRTGSHWLRMMMERYFERPSLVRIFFYPEKTDYLSYHTHDKNLRFVHPHVIYLYRDPVDTVYSQMQFCGGPLDRAGRVRHWTGEYAANLSKWLLTETFTEKKLILRYENLRNEPATEFAKLCDWYGTDFDAARFEQAKAGLTRQRVDSGTSDRRVVNLRSEYAEQRKMFREMHFELIWEMVKAAGLMPHFEDEAPAG